MSLLRKNIVKDLRIPGQVIAIDIVEDDKNTFWRKAQFGFKMRMNGLAIGTVLITGYVANRVECD